MATGLRRINNRTRAVRVIDHTEGVILTERYANGDLKYLGFHKDQDAATSDENWVVHYFVWDGNGLVSRESIMGIYDNRDSLDWR